MGKGLGEGEAAHSIWRHAQKCTRKGLVSAGDKGIGFSVFRFKNSKKRRLSKEQRALMELSLCLGGI